MIFPSCVRKPLLRLILVFAAVSHVALVTAKNALPEEPALMPQPASVNWGKGAFVLDDTFRIRLEGAADARVENAVRRLVTRLEQRTGRSFSSARESSAGRTLRLKASVAASAIPQLGEAEAYTLGVTPEGISLEAETTLGLLRGVETLQQLLVAPGNGQFGFREVEIKDQPRFPWRGLMMDVSRHWLPKEAVKRNLEGMAHVKLNVLHFHLSDDQGFRVESKRRPELQEHGSDGKFFTQDELREIVAHAAELGIRVVPEFDVPGHATSWLVSHPELGSAPGPYHIERHWGIFDPVFDPTNEGTYSLLGDVFAEMAAIFPDPFFHIGGDENNGVHWNANARIQQFIRDRNLGSNEGLHTYFNTRLSEILDKLGKRVVGWDEILQPGLPQSAVIQSWRGTEALATAARKGYSGILSNGYYIDLAQPASEHYQVDPLPANSTLTAEERSRVLGGEATMWAEWVDADTVDSRIWPRAAAIAERLWSPGEVNDVASLYSRLRYISQRLDEIGMRHIAYLPDAVNHLLERPETPERLEALRKFIDIVEPVKIYRRTAHQPHINQLMPLRNVADAARPDSAPSLEFTRAVMDLAQGTLGDERRHGLKAQLEEWRAVGEEVGWRIGPQHAALVDASQIAKQLKLAAELGLEALERLDAPGDLEVWRWHAARVLERAGKTNASAIELPFLPALKVLVTMSAGTLPKVPESKAHGH